MTSTTVSELPNYSTVCAELAGHVIRRRAGVVGSREGRWMCKNPAGYESWFEVTAWTSCIVMTGDRGEWVFARNNTDMISFFERSEVADGQNLDYLHEKLQASDVRSGSKRFSVESYHDAIEYAFEQCDEDEQFAYLRHKNELIKDEPETEDEALDLLREADWLFPDELPSVREYTYGFVWACRALTWFARNVQIELAEVPNE